MSSSHPAAGGLRRRSSAALDDERLQRALSLGISTSLESRRQAVEEVTNWQELRRHASRVKDHTIANLGRYLEELEQRLSELGVVVLWASTPAEAVAAITAVGRRHGVRRVIKSKTMIGEEIGLNEGLEAAGFEVLESDLGEYIVQLAGETPSHIVAPALHKSQQDVAELFARELDPGVADDARQLTLTARKHLRESFLAADMGISGVNFAVAEDGTLVVVENEGNARLTTALPDVHVALMSLEKVVPRRRDLSVFLRLLVRSATGQRATSYVNLIRGPRREGETDGPTAQYVVILDNGRSRIAAEPRLGKVLRCIRCGACQNACPVFQRVGGHAYDSVYQGPIGALLSPQLGARPAAVEHPFASSLCGVCREVCPVEIDIPHLLVELRHRAKGGGGTEPFSERVGWRLWARVASSPRLFSWAGTLVRGLLRSPARSLLATGPLAAWRLERELPPIPRRSFRSQYLGGRL